MAESSLLQSGDEQTLLRAALEHPFEPPEVPLTSRSTPSTSPSLSTSALAPTSSGESSAEGEDTWQTNYSSQVSEWRAQSASARAKAELNRAKWETIRAREAAQRDPSWQPPESWDRLGEHITVSTAAASEAVSRSQSQSHSHDLSSSLGSLGSVEHVSESHAQPEESVERAPRGKTETGSPSQPWEQISSSPSSSFPSMSFPEASLPQSPYHEPDALPSTAASGLPQTYLHPAAAQNPTQHPTSTLPSIMDNSIAPRTRLSLVLSSLAINLFLPFINGVMLGFGEIFAKDVLVGWFGSKMRPGSVAARLGLRR